MRCCSCRMQHGVPYPGLSGDFYFEDPRKNGILRNTNCRKYREQMRGMQQGNILQGMMIITGLATVLVAIWFHTMEVKCDGELSQLEALWLGVSSFLGLSEQECVTARTYHCQQELQTKRIFRQIARQVLNQEQALARLERVLQSQRHFKSVALLGPSGVGKTITAMTLRQNFPWPENVHAYSWSTYVPDDVKKFHMIRNFKEHLSDCGQNLLIIDDLSTCDYGIVPIYNKLLQEREATPGQTILNPAANQTVLVVYIFNLEIEYYWQQFELLQQLPVDTTIINYRPFGRQELFDCLELELRQEQRRLNANIISNILEEALEHVEQSGCKRLREIILQYGLSDLQ